MWRGEVFAIADCLVFHVIAYFTDVGMNNHELIYTIMILKTTCMNKKSDYEKNITVFDYHLIFRVKIHFF